MKNYRRKLIFIPLIISFFLGCVGYFQLYKINKIQEHWNDYLNNIDSKGVLIDELKDSLGFGGSHHAFKNYVLRGDEKYSKMAEKVLGNSFLTLKKIESIEGNTEQELYHIHNIQRTIKEYKDNIAVVRKMKESGASIGEIDKAVKVDDRPAIVGFHWLKENQLRRKESASLKISESEMEARVALVVSYIITIMFIFLITYYTSIKLVEAKIKAESVANLKSNFLANMSHEIRTPLNGIIGFTGILSDMKLSREVSEQVNYIRECGESLAGIINDILDFSKISAGKLNVVRSDFNLLNCINSTIHIFDHITTSRGIDLSLKIDDNVPKFIASDSLRLKQVLTNLVGNSVKFTEKGSISVRVQLEKQTGPKLKLLFTIKDTGIGISKEAQERLFYSFEQADVTTSRKYGGTGLGLSISKKLIEAMGGEISVSSEEGKGSEFKFSIVAKVAENIIEEQKGLISKDRESKKDLKILIAEDNKVNQLLVKKLLQKLGFNNFKIVENGKMAIESLNDEEFELILMDIQMPVMDGYEATKTILKYWTGEKKPIIYALSANVLEEDKKKAREIGFDGYIEKPIDLDNFAKILEGIS